MCFVTSNIFKDFVLAFPCNSSSFIFNWNCVFFFYLNAQLSFAFCFSVSNLNFSCSNFSLCSLSSRSIVSSLIRSLRSDLSILILSSCSNLNVSILSLSLISGSRICKFVWVTRIWDKGIKHFLVNEELNQNILNYMFKHRPFDRGQFLMSSNIQQISLFGQVQQPLRRRSNRGIIVKWHGCFLLDLPSLNDKQWRFF